MAIQTPKPLYEIQLDHWIIGSLSWIIAPCIIGHCTMWRGCSVFFFERGGGGRRGLGGVVHFGGCRVGGGVRGGEGGGGLLTRTELINSSSDYAFLLGPLIPRSIPAIQRSNPIPMIQSSDLMFQWSGSPMSRDPISNDPILRPMQVIFTDFRAQFRYHLCTWIPIEPLYNPSFHVIFHVILHNHCWAATKSRTQSTTA